MDITTTKENTCERSIKSLIIGTDINRCSGYDHEV